MRDSLRKEQFIKDELAAKGLSSLLSSIRLDLKTSDAPKKQHDKFISAVVRDLRKGKFSWEEMVDSLQQGYKSMEIATLSPGELHYDYIVKLLERCCKMPVKGICPVKITYGGNVGYSFKGVTFPKRRHNCSLRLSGSPCGYQLVFDFYTIVAEAYVENTLYDYVAQNKDILQYLVIEKYMVDVRSKKLRLPMDKDFRKDVTAIVQNFPWSDYEQELHEVIDIWKEVFYFTVYNDVAKLLMITEFLQQVQYLHFKAEKEFRQRSSYARSFETKRYITYKTQNAMNSNAFLKYYGYVELDNDVDLHRFHALEDEFKEFTSHISIPVAKDHSFRIKKLGKYRAEGIYFPHCKATILDVNHPQSYAHELAHQIDYIMGKAKSLLSEEINFRYIILCYKKIVNEAVHSLPENAPFRKRWNGKAKYNCEYFFQNTEIFARSFEMYLHHKGIQNKLLESNFKGEPVYPNGTEYLELIGKYFGNLLQRIENEHQSLPQH